MTQSYTLDAMTYYRNAGDENEKSLMDICEKFLTHQERIIEKMSPENVHFTQSDRGHGSRYEVEKFGISIESSDFFLWLEEALKGIEGVSVTPLMAKIEEKALFKDLAAESFSSPEEMFDFFNDRFSTLSLEENAQEALDKATLGVISSIYQYLRLATGFKLTDDDEVKVRQHFLTCPFCGGAAALSIVKEGGVAQGHHRELWCDFCGCSWPFERIRCAGCGQSAVEHLSYRHREDDSAHRIHCCSKCGTKMPTVFQSELKAPVLVPQVEAFVLVALEEALVDEEAKS